MSKLLFDNVGLDIKEYAHGMYTSTMTGYVLLALVATVAGFALLQGLGFIVLVIAIVMLYFGHLRAKLAVMKLYAYGELVERVMAIENKVCNSKAGGRGPKPVPNDDRRVKPEPLDLPITEKNPDGTWKCLFCEFTNPPDAKSCKKCTALARFK